MTQQKDEIETLPLETPGDMLRLDYLPDAGLSVEDLARNLFVEPETIQAVLEGHHPIDADMAARLGRFFDQSPQYWLNLQADYERRSLERQDATLYEQIQPWRGKAA